MIEKIAITGSSGFIAKTLIETLRQNGHSIINISRTDFKNETLLEQKLQDSTIVINLCGEKILQRWSKKAQNRILLSRVANTAILVRHLPRTCHSFLSASAIGIYKPGIVHDENAAQNSDFLAHVCRSWETQAKKAQTKTRRVCIMRFGVVLGNGGAIAQMTFPFMLNLGGKIGSGIQGLAWIHIEDLCRGVLFLMQDKTQNGNFNFCAPCSTNNFLFTKALGEVLKKKTFFTVPVFVLRLFYGKASIVLTNSYFVNPKKLLAEGFKFKFKDIKKALAAIFQDISNN